MECRASSTATDECPAPTGNLGWVSDQATTDNDEDGCQDSGEDLDDDEDGIGDGFDDCSAGTVGWAPGPTTDYDSDGCRDAGEDLDDDNDDICDSGGSSTYGDSSSCEPSSTGTDECTAYSSDLGWTSTPLTDNDEDGCQDTTEDIDDDNDGVTDSGDNCQFVPNGPLLGADNQLNYDLIHESVEEGDACDLDDDEDGVDDDAPDNCPRFDSALGWTSSSTNDYDGDGCKDDVEDFDDDGDGVGDGLDDCNAYTSDLGWISSGTTDYDTDGCQDSNEDLDDDNDNICDANGGPSSYGQSSSCAPSNYTIGFLSYRHFRLGFFSCNRLRY